MKTIMVTIDQIIEYVLNTPMNTNKIILRQMLEDLKIDDDEEIIYDGGGIND